MERLSGVDAGFLYMETPTQHMHTLKIAVLDVSGLDGAYSFDLLRQELSARLGLLPPFRRRVVPLPFAFHHPVWVEDPEFDVAAHLHRVPLPAPGSWEQVEQTIGEIAAVGLARDKPLWEIHVVEGLADGRVVVVAKIHHTLADGVAAAALLANVMRPEGEDGEPGLDRWTPGALPERRDLVRAGVRDLLGQLLTLPALLAHTLGRVVQLAKVRRATDVKLPRPLLDTPRTSFNRALSSRRSFATSALPFTDVRSVAKGFGVTVNDVVLALTGGALRKWFTDRGETVDRPLLASVPVATEKGQRLVGNRLSSLLAPIHVEVADPLDRLRKTHDGAVAAKAVQQALGEDMMESWVQFTPPGPFQAFMRLYSRVRGADRVPPPINLVVSNVPGPREPLVVAGARLDDLFSVGPVLEGIGLNITAWSYLDRINVSLLACPDSLPDLRAVAACFPAALAELLDALPYDAVSSARMR